MKLPGFVFQSEVVVPVMLKVSADSARDSGTDVKMSFLIRTPAGTGVTGPAGKWSRHAGRRRGGRSSRCPGAWSFWTGSSSSGPALPAWSGKFAHGEAAHCHSLVDAFCKYLGMCIYYEWERNHSVQRWWAEMSLSNEFVLCARLWAQEMNCLFVRG